MTDDSPQDKHSRSKNEPGWFTVSDDGVLSVGGIWRLAHVPELARTLSKPSDRPGKPESVDAQALHELDSAGAQLLLRTANGAPITGVADRFKGLMHRVADAEEAIADMPRRRKPRGWLVQLEHIGQRTVDVGKKIWQLLGFLGLSVMATGRVILRPWKLDWRATVYHLEHTGLNALPIVGLLAFLVGIVVAFMGALQLRKFGAEIFTVDLVGISLLRELGVLFAAIMVAGRSGSAFTAQIGTMSINEEIDAMRAIGLDPVQTLVVPRIIALVIALPLLTIYANLVGLAGGAVISASVLDISFSVFLQQLSGAIDMTTFLIGLSKAPIFAAAIAIIGCFEGFKVAGSAASVGRRTTTAVVEAIFIVILIDAAFAIALSWLGI